MISKELVNKIRNNPELVTEVARELQMSEREVNDIVNASGLQDAEETLRAVIDSNDQAAPATNTIDPNLQRNTIA